MSTSTTLTGQRSWLPGTLALLALVGLVFFLRAKLPVAEWLEPARAWVGQFGYWAALVLGVAIALGTTIAIPGSVMAIVAGLALGMWTGLITAWLGLGVGCCLCFLISRWAFSAKIDSYAAARPRLTALREALHRRGWHLLLMLRLTPLVPLVVTNYLAGVSGVRFRHAALAAGLGILPATSVYVGLGAAGGSETTTKPAFLVGIGLVATIGLGIVSRRILAEVLEP